MLPITIPAILALYSAACLCLGSLTVRFLSGKAPVPCSAVTTLTSAFLLGQGVFANVWLLLSLWGSFSAAIVWAGVISAIAGRVVFIWPNLVASIQQFRDVWVDLRRESWGCRLVALMTVLLILAGFTSLGRPLEGDAAAFYMALPKVIAASHRLAPLPGHDAFTQVGLQGEMHSAALMAMGSGDAAQLFAWPTILAGALLLAAIGSKAGLGRRGQWIVLASVFTSSAVIYLSGDGKVDLFAAALGLAAYFWAMRTGEGQDRLAIPLAGLFTGLAVVAKFSYLPVLLPGVAVLILWKLVADFKEKRRLGFFCLRVGSILLQTGFWMALAVIPHLLKNYALFGNPLAPFSSSGMGWAGQKWFAAETTQRIVLTYPLALTFGQYWAQYGNLSPLVLAFAPLALLLPRPSSFLGSPLAAITLAALTGLGCWVILNPSLLSPRYILSTLLVFIPLAARGAEYVSVLDTGPRWLGGSVLGCIFVTQVVVGTYFSGQVFFLSGTKRYLTGRMSQCDRDGEYCRSLTALNEQAEPGDRVLLAAYYRYWLRPDLLQCVSTEDELKDLRERSPEAFWLGAREGGFRYLAVDRTTHGSLMENLKIENLPIWVSVALTYEKGNLLIYLLAFNDPPVRPVAECRQARPPAWDLVAR